MSKVKVAVLGSGNIGSDLMMKLRRAKNLQLTTVIGIDPNSDGLKRAKEYGYITFEKGIDDFLQHLELADIVFDATGAKAHIRHAKLLKEAGKRVIDLTPAAVGPFVVPTVNLEEHENEDNVNMVTCGGQATTPIVHAMNCVQPISYAEVIATVSSRSAGPATRANINEFIETTNKALETIGGAKKGKTVLIINPAEPPIIMRDTIHALFEGETIDKEAIVKAIYDAEKKVQAYVPGYRIRTEPIFDGNQVTILIEVEGAGDYLPKYAGNLDIITAASVQVAEQWAAKIIANSAV
ncbi:acetaldehyde dehydrogenase (acetylating) [Calidifontibacillus erzurumensis]|uniref:Acetaldehyde dehydrogenase n=1 Tax=Calidifontibacillus erzurumensis TaxID=2741433 RepID=A0A8J8GEY5_9BACI|nr:acetaldehyde dehydrogenase (acetylating) [Calidifontibacillus erzurumensis]NSL50578.1 acetaldehyde dehydrogenase (acetylating) [Calidifontibacillus erzurumensis]